MNNICLCEYLKKNFLPHFCNYQLLLKRLFNNDRYFQILKKISLNK